MYDLVIIGAGPAGLSAAICAARGGLNFLVVEQDGYGGGQITAAHQVQNYPGAPEISGEALGERLRQQAVDLGAEIAFGQVTGLRQREQGLEVELEEGQILSARTVIAATGASPRTLGVPGEGAFASYCATCDGAFYAGKDVLVVGGGDTAIEDGLYLSGICRRVTVILRGDRFRGAKRRAELLGQRDNVTVLTHTTLEALEGEKRLQAVRLHTPEGEQTLPMDGVFVAVGVMPETEYLRSLPLTFAGGYVMADETTCTTVPGLFVAGDVRKKPLRQVTTAVADGANAVHSVLAYLQTI